MRPVLAILAFISLLVGIGGLSVAYRLADLEERVSILDQKQRIAFKQNDASGEVKVWINGEPQELDPGQPTGFWDAERDRSYLKTISSRSVPEPINHQGGMMPEAEKTFGTPIEWVRFSWEKGQDQTIEGVVSRTIYGEGANMLVVVRDDQGAFVAVRGWVMMEQSPAASFF